MPASEVEALKTTTKLHLGVFQSAERRGRCRAIRDSEPERTFAGIGKNPVTPIWRQQEKKGSRASIASAEKSNARYCSPTASKLAVRVERLVCAQHGRVANGVKDPCERTKHEIKSPVEANSGRVTDRGQDRLNESCEPMNKNCMEGRYDRESWHHTALGRPPVVSRHREDVAKLPRFSSQLVNLRSAFILGGAVSVLLRPGGLADHLTLMGLLLVTDSVFWDGVHPSICESFRRTPGSCRERRFGRETSQGRVIFLALGVANLVDIELTRTRMNSDPPD